MFRFLVFAIAIFGSFTVAEAQVPPIGCPNIKVVEPPGVAMFGDTVEFRLVPNLLESANVQIEWTTSAGAIENGQGTSNIMIRSSLERPPKVHTIFAKAIIKGLPNHCVAVYGGSAIVGCCIDPIIIDEFGKLPENDQKARFDIALAELRKNADNTCLFVLRSKKGETEIQL